MKGRNKLQYTQKVPTLIGDIPRSLAPSEDADELALNFSMASRWMMSRCRRPMTQGRRYKWVMDLPVALQFGLEKVTNQIQ